MLGTGSQFNIATGGMLTMSGVIGDTANGFTKAGAGNLVLSASSTYTGATLLTAGTLTLNNANALGAFNVDLQQRHCAGYSDQWR